MSVHSIYKSEAGKAKLQSAYNDYLKRLGADFERMEIETRFGKTHVLATGPADGKPVFIFQGGNSINPLTLSMFSSLFSAYRIYAPDTIGHPGFSAETRVSGKDDSLALWVSDLMDRLQINRCAFIGPSYGGGITLRLATYMPERIACAVLFAPAGLILGSKLKMIRKILLPMLLYMKKGSISHLQKIADVMSSGTMKDTDRDIIGNIFTHVRLEQDMPKLTTREELQHYKAPTLVIAGKDDIFFPGDKVVEKAKATIPNLIAAQIYEMGHIPSEDALRQINAEIGRFLNSHY